MDQPRLFQQRPLWSHTRWLDLQRLHQVWLNLSERNRKAVRQAIYLLATLSPLILFTMLIVFLPQLLPARLNPTLHFTLVFGLALVGLQYHTWLKGRLTQALPQIPIDLQAEFIAYSQRLPHLKALPDILACMSQTLHVATGSTTVSIWLHQAETHLLLPVHQEDEAQLHAELPLDIPTPELTNIALTQALPASALRQGLLALNVERVIPLKLHGQLLGLIGLGPFISNRPLRRTLLPFLTAVACQATLAIKTNHLQTELESMLAQLQIAYQRTIDAQEEERRHLAAELHDDILGRLTSMAFTLRKSRNTLEADVTQVGTWLDMMAHEAVCINQSLRELMQNLYPSVLIDLGLISALQADLDNLTKRALPAATPQRITLTAQGFGHQRLMDKKLERDLYRITRQALDNALLHAQADQIFIHLAWQQDQVSITVKDTGQGMGDDPKILMGKNGRLGLLSMTERARAWQGQLTFDTQTNHGTTVMAQIPINCPSCEPADLQVFTHYL